MKNTMKRTWRALGVLALAPGAPALAGGILDVPSAYPTIQAAINAARPGDVVRVAPGVYSGAGNRDVSTLGKAITVRGSGAATCVIDVAAGNEYHTGFLIRSAETSATVIEGFTITGGYQFNGGAVMVTSASPTIRQCVFTGNRVDCWGGAVYFEGNSAPRLSNCVIFGNSSSDEGGGVFTIGGTPRIENCVIRDNQAANGGGVCVLGGQAMFVNCSITGNSADYYGGGAYVWQGQLVNCTVAANGALFQGSGVYLGGNGGVTNSIVWSNTGPSPLANANQGQSGVSFSIVQGGAAGQKILSSDPLFRNASAGDFRLAPASPGIDAGSNAALPAGVVLDLAGAPRVMTGVTAAGAAAAPKVDLGAYEYFDLSSLSLK